MDHRINDVDQATWWNHIEGCSQKRVMDIAVLTTKLEIYDPKRMALRKNPMFVVAGPSSSMACLSLSRVYHASPGVSFFEIMVNIGQPHDQMPAKSLPFSLLMTMAMREKNGKTASSMLP